jgi:hypothetical protein
VGARLIRSLSLGISGAARSAPGRPEIPTKHTRLIQHSADHTVYVMRNRIERFINRLKNSRRVATRYDHTVTSFLGFVLLTSIRIWIRFVHAASLGRNRCWQVRLSLSPTTGKLSLRQPKAFGCLRHPQMFQCRRITFRQWLTRPARGPVLVSWMLSTPSAGATSR